MSHRVEFGNVQLYNWLLTIGLTPKKTHTVGAIDVPNELFRDFLRGSLDGDGTITTYTDHFNTYKNPKYIYKRIFLRFLTASKTHIEWLQSMATKNLGVVGRIHKIKPAKPNNVPMYTLKFGKKESLKALSQMYYSNSAPCLKRKRQKYKNFINNRNQNNV